MPLHRVHQAENVRAGRSGGLAGVDVVLEILGEGAAGEAGVAELLAQASARMGDSVWLGAVTAADGPACRLRISSGPVHCSGDRAHLAVVFDPRLLPGRLARGALAPGSCVLVDGGGSWRSWRAGETGFAVRIQAVPFGALASRIPAFPRGERMVALGVLAWMLKRDPDLLRHLVTNRLAARGRRAVSAALRLFELGWREAPHLVPGPLPIGGGARPPVRWMRAARGWDVLDGLRAVALGALSAGMTRCTVETDHPQAARVARAFAALGGRVLGGGGSSLKHCEPKAGFPAPRWTLSAAGWGVGDPAGPGVLPRHPGSDPRVKVYIDRLASSDGEPSPFAVHPLSLSAGCPGGPRPVLLSPASIEECFGFMHLARRIVQVHRRDCALLVDGALLDAAESSVRSQGRPDPVWTDWLDREAVSGPELEAAGWGPGTPGGNAAAGQGSLACDAFSAGRSGRGEEAVLAALGVVQAPIESFLRLPEPVGGSEGDVLLLGWGMTRGPVEEAVLRLRERGMRVSALHLRVIHPWPPGLGRLLAGFRRVVALDVAVDGAGATRRSRHLLHLAQAAVVTEPAGRLRRPQLAAHVFNGTEPLSPAAVEAFAAAAVREVFGYSSVIR
ncbi:MAG: hypothetical protein H0Z37_03830 [Firmicutes bacterium]|nr:hypothetical protein [Bacillota bacterium]